MHQTSTRDKEEDKSLSDGRLVAERVTSCRGDGRHAIPSQRDGSRYASFSWTRMSPSSSCPSRRVCRPSSPGDCRCPQSPCCLAGTLIPMTRTAAAAAAGSNFPPSRLDRLSLSMLLICSLLLRKYCPHKREHRPCSQLQTMTPLNAFPLLLCSSLVRAIDCHVTLL